MRSIGQAQEALDTMILRITDPTRKTFGKFLWEHGTYTLSHVIRKLMSFPS
jgi:acyl-CoA dehydrogenase